MEFIDVVFLTYLMLVLIGTCFMGFISGEVLLSIVAYIVGVLTLIPINHFITGVFNINYLNSSNNNIVQRLAHIAIGLIILIPIVLLIIVIFFPQLLDDDDDDDEDDDEHYTNVEDVKSLPKKILNTFIKLFK